AHATPPGWSEPRHLTPGQNTGDRLLPYGRPFGAATDSLRAALDCAVLSPTGWAVAVDAAGRVTGVVSQQAIGEAIRGAHAESGADAVRDADAEPDEDGKVQKVAP
ncbi:ABC transporter ATP-binding protein, partial [Streptomyces sp. NPDC006356]